MVSDMGTSGLGLLDRGRGGWTAVLGSTAALFMLCFPLSMPPMSSLVQTVSGSVHVLLWAGLAWLWGRILPCGLRGWALWGMLAVVGGGVEWLQPFAGRSAEWTDWALGVGGAGCICGTWQLQWRRGVIRGIAVLILFSSPLSWALALQGLETHSFPMLAEPGTLWSRNGWILNGVRLSTSSPKAFRIEKEILDETSSPFPYPGVFRAPARSDWRGVQSWRTEIYWPDSSSVVFAVRVDDRPGNPPYAERFQREFAITQGWNSVEISVEDLGRTSGGRSMRLDDIRLWGLFLVSNVHFDYFLAGAVRLELKEDRI